MVERLIRESRARFADEQNRSRRMGSAFGDRRAEARIDGFGSIEQPGRRAGLSDLPHLVKEARADRYPFLHPFGRILRLRVARHHDRLGRVDRRGDPDRRRVGRR
jgi:hypothetical protein